MLQAIQLLKWIVNMFSSYWRFEGVEFENFEVDQSPDFYLMVITLRPKKEGE